VAVGIVRVGSRVVTVVALRRIPAKNVIARLI
jgi:hypothetical protein